MKVDKRRRFNGRLEHLRAPPSGSAASPTTSPDPCWRPADSDHDYTLNCDEPLKFYTPTSVHNGTWPHIQTLRQQTLDAAYATNPHRFTRPPVAPAPPTEA